MKLLSYIILLLLVSLGQASEYVPGTPGAVWSDEEVRVVRLKILELLSLDSNKMDEMFPTRGKDAEFDYIAKGDHPISENVLYRLSFHDCLAYEDGSPGCDGCINWKNMGNRAPSPFSNVKDRYCEHQFDRMDKTDNNGLLRITSYLEKIYTDKDWPNYENAKAPSLEVSLKESGKSRADLWQFAANVALEKTIERANHACRYDMWTRQQVPLLEGVNKGHDLAYGIWKCKIKLTEPVKFRFGRKDCIPETTEENPELPEGYPFATWKPEAHENPHENIDTLLGHLKANLEMTAKDFIALSSIHGMIAPFNAGSIGTKYRWLGSGPYLSNMYYKLLANKPTYFWSNGFGMNPTAQTNNPNYTNFRPFAIGDAEGNPVSSWGFRVGCSDCWNTEQSTMGGPCVWRPTNPSAPDCPNKDSFADDCFDGFDMDTLKRKVTLGSNNEKTCCSDVTYGEDGIQRGSSPSCTRYTNTGSTKGWSNMFALNYEVGLTHKFDLDEVAFRPKGCNGIELADITSDWTDVGGSHSNSQWLSPVADCEKQDLVADGVSTFDIVEEFADDHSVWAEAFLGAWQRMQEMRQDPDVMKDGPANSWLGYYPLQEIGAPTGTTAEEFTSFIEENSPVVFTTESVDPNICHDRTDFCSWRVSEIYERAGVPIEAMGTPCSNFVECNNPEF